MPKRRLDDMPPHGRRRFFSASLSRLVGPLAQYLETKLPIELPVVRTLLRPPGAISERQFLDTCFRCGSCADACPADAIALATEGDPLVDKALGTPFVNPDRQACVICDELVCMKVCPSGALRLVGRMEIRMGLAVVDHAVCVRSAGEACTVCIDRCPMGRVAIRLDDRGRIEVVDPGESGHGCTGCGVCQQHCPTTPTKAIRIEPY